MLLKIFLLAYYSCFLYLKSFYVFQLDLGLFAKNLTDYSFKVVVDLSHDFNFTLLDLIPQ